VRNLDNGGVEVAAQGSAEAIAILRAAVEQGPPGAVVRDVIERPPAVSAEFPSPFTVIR
jgi:acylphosphatase